MERQMTEETMERHQLILESDGVAVIAISPQNLRSVLLDDGWHDLTGAKLIQFAVAPGASPPKPNKFYAAISFKDTATKKQIIVPLSQVLAFQGIEEVAASR